MVLINKSTVAIILVNHCGWKDTIESLESILKQTYSDFMVFVVDNSSSCTDVENIKKWANGTLSVCETQFPFFINPFVPKPIPYQFLHEENLYYNNVLTEKLIIIRTENNNGFSHANNIAIKYIHNNYDNKLIWLLNNDTVIAPTTLEKLVDAINENENIGIYGTVLNEYFDSHVIQAVGGQLNKCFGTIKEVKDIQGNNNIDYPIGASFVITRNCMNSIGYLNEDYFLYFEELDYVHRAKKNNFVFKILENIIVYHKGGATTINSSNNSRSKFIDLHTLRSRLIFMKTYYPERAISVYFGFLFVILNRILRGQFSYIPDIVKLLICSRTVKSIK